MSGRMPASSQASSELSTASFTAVRSALEGLSKPSRWRFLVKNSEMEISRCLLAIDSAVARRPGLFSSLAGASTTGGGGLTFASGPAFGFGGGGTDLRGGGTDFGGGGTDLRGGGAD